MKKNTVLLVFCLIAFVSANTYAQQGFTGGTPQGFTGGTQPAVQPGFIGQALTPRMVSQPITVNEAKNLPHDSWVILTGNIMNMLPGGHNYTFRDASGEITVDIGPKEWRGVSVGSQDNIVIYGEVKIHRGLTSIKVHAISGPGHRTEGRTGTWAGQTVFIDRPISTSEAAALTHDSFVILNGNIVSAQAGHHNFTFRDASGEITVDLGPKEWRGLSIGASDRVEIYGEVKNHRGLFSVKVHAIKGY